MLKLPDDVKINAIALIYKLKKSYSIRRVTLFFHQ